MAIYTRRGDNLETCLLDGKRVYKNDLRIETYGVIDELISVLGVASCFTRDVVTTHIVKLQRHLSVIASELSSPSGKGLRGEVLKRSAVEEMETDIDKIVEALSPMSGFVIPGPPVGAAFLHQARTVARRAERVLVGLYIKENKVRNDVIIYLNRISDYLFVLALYEEHEYVVSEAVARTKRILSIRNREFREKEGLNMSLSLSAAKKLIEDAERKAEEIGVPMVVAVVDAGGNPVALHRMDGSLLASLDIALNKAYTALSLRLPTGDLANLARPGQPLYGIDSTNHGRIVVFGGGLPLFSGQNIIGGIGVSGGTVEQDVVVAEWAVKASPYRYSISQDRSE